MAAVAGEQRQHVRGSGTRHASGAHVAPLGPTCSRFSARYLLHFVAHSKPFSGEHLRREVAGRCAKRRLSTNQNLSRENGSVVIGRGGGPRGASSAWRLTTLLSASHLANYLTKPKTIVVVAVSTQTPRLRYRAEVQDVSQIPIPSELGEEWTAYRSDRGKRKREKKTHK